MKIGFLELIVIFVVALIVLGPEKLPLYAKKLGQALTAFKDYSGKFAEEMNASIGEPLKEVAEPLQKVAQDISAPLNEVKQTIQDIGKPMKQSTPTQPSAQKTQAEVGNKQEVINANTKNEESVAGDNLTVAQEEENI